MSPVPPSHPVGVPDADEEPEPPRRRWYGWQTLIADGSVLGVVTAAVIGGNSLSDEQSEAFAYAVFGGYLLATPIVHAAHGSPGRAFGSGGMRLGVPIVVGIGAGATGCAGKYCAAAVGLFGALGALGVMAIDATVLAYEDADVSAPRVALVVAVSPGMTYVGARGAF